MESYVWGRLPVVVFVMVLLAPMPAAAQETTGALLAKLASSHPHAAALCAHRLVAVGGRPEYGHKLWPRGIAQRR